jgi:hypothetical protein
MTETSEKTAETPGPTQRISSFVFAVIIIALVLSLAALYFALQAWSDQTVDITTRTTNAALLLVIGFAGLGLSTYILFQTRRRVMRLSLEIPPVLTTTACPKCGFKNVREFERGDFIFKKVGPCPKCNDPLLVSAIYREVKEKPKKEMF